MIFTKIPNELASYQQPLIYEFDNQTTATELTVKIFDGNDTLLGSKRLYGEIVSGAVDIAPYLRHARCAALPTTPTASGVEDSPYDIDVVVEIEGLRSEVRRFIAAKVDAEQEAEVLDLQIGHRTIAYDEFDMIGLVACSTNPIEVVIEGFDHSTLINSLTLLSQGVGQKVVAVRPADFDKTLRSIKVSISCNQQTLAVVEYEVRQSLATAERIGWLNEHFAPQLYTFPLRKSLLVEATRRQMESLWGKEAAALEQRNELKLISAYEPRAQIEALSRILSSPKVWLQRGSSQAAVELTTNRVLIAPVEGVSFVELDLQAAEEGVLLW